MVHELLQVPLTPEERLLKSFRWIAADELVHRFESTLPLFWIAVVTMRILHNCTPIPSVDAAYLVKNWPQLPRNTLSFRRPGVE